MPLREGVRVPRRSAGLLLYRRVPELEVLLVHPGGPLHARRDVWGVPKGEYPPDEPPLEAAYREFAEELGVAPPDGEPLPLGEVVQKGGKRVVTWALEGDVDPADLRSNLFTMVWQGRAQQFPEVDRAEWFTVAQARTKVLPAQEPFLDRLLDHLG